MVLLVTDTQEPRSLGSMALGTDQNHLTDTLTLEAHVQILSAQAQILSAQTDNIYEHVDVLSDISHKTVTAVEMLSESQQAV